MAFILFPTLQFTIAVSVFLFYCTKHTRTHCKYILSINIFNNSYNCNVSKRSYTLMKNAHYFINLYKYIKTRLIFYLELHIIFNFLTNEKKTKWTLEVRHYAFCIKQLQHVRLGQQIAKMFFGLVVRQAESTRSIPEELVDLRPTVI